MVFFFSLISNAACIVLHGLLCVLLGLYPGLEFLGHRMCIYPTL